MKQRQFKSSASAARAFGTASPAFGFSAAPGFGTSSSPLSYLNELPDLSSISNSNLVVAFKNLSKRDATTKSKALDDLQVLLIDQGSEIEDGVLDAWTNIYPRTSIETSRRVRQLAHTLQGHITAKSGKRIAKRMPSVVGAWLAGIYDSDKAVARAASEALSQVFSTQEKRQALWKAYQEPLLDFCHDVFDKESPQTLSDERSISPDESNGKYNRVVTSAIGLLSSLISELKEEDFNKNITRYTDIMQDKKLWEKALSEDVAVRRATHRMLKGFLQGTQARSCLDLSMLSKIYLSKGLDSDQSGSAGDYLDAILALTETDPTVWTGRWQDKKPPSSRLKAFVKRGSQGSAITFWSTVSKLFTLIPEIALPTDPEKSRDVIKALHNGVTRKDEPRPFVVEGLKVYIQITNILLKTLPATEQLSLSKDTILPLISQYLLPKADNAKWNVPTNAVQTLLQEALKSKEFETMILSEFPNLTGEFVQEIISSQPEQANEYIRCQDDLGKTGQRFAGLVGIMIRHEITHDHQLILEQSAADVLKESLSVLLNHQGKPYGAASVASALIQQCRELIDDAESLSTIVEEFLDSRIAIIYVSPSFKQLAAILSACEDQEEVFDPAWNRCLNAVLADKSSRRFDALTELLISRKTISETELHHLGPLLADEILPKVDRVWSTPEGWDVILQLLARSSIISKLFGETVLDRITQALIATPTEASTALEGLRGMSTSSTATLKSFLGSESGKKLLPNLLLLSESPNEKQAKEASELIPVVQNFMGNETSQEHTGNVIIDVIHDGLTTANASSVSVDTLVNHAKSLLDSKLIGSLASLLPDAEKWWAALEPYLSSGPDKSLAITSPLSGAVYLIANEPSNRSQGVQRDGESFSIPLRMALYVVKLCSTAPEGPLDVITTELFAPLTFTILLANDHLSIDRPENLWSHRDMDILIEISDFVADGQRLISHWYATLRTKDSKFHPFTGTAGFTTKAYYSALAETRLVSEWVESQGPTSQNLKQLEDELKNRRSAANELSTLAHLLANQTAMFSSSAVIRYCNELVADLTTLQTESLRSDGFTKLVTLDTILNGYEDIGETIAKPRLSRFVSKAVSWLTDESVDDDLIAVIYRVMIPLLPLVSDMYGSYWSSILDSIKGNLELVSELPDSNAPALIPALHASLRLYAVLRRVKSGESAKSDDERNDDVIEAWNDIESGINAAMVNALKVPRNVSDEQHQPLMIFNELLSREISRIPTSKLSAMEELYPQLYSPSPAVQQAAYRLLHRYIPSKQEQVSLDAVLDKTDARLPDELLSLVLETPSAIDLHDDDFERSVPLQLRGYLLSWLLIFDHFTNASHKVRNDYGEHMKEAGHLNDFLDFAFDFLGHSKGKPIDVSKFDIISYNSSAMEDSPLKDTQWLLTHLYYLCLTQFPSLSKTWWIECKARQKSISVESWTAKFISPLVISTALENVASWSATQEPTHTSEEPPPLVIRINHRASELVAAYPMDDEGQSAVIIITLPTTFPLHNAKVSSPSKSMAVDERRWNTWLRNSQAIIAFSNNSIIDGLLAWRRNVFGALKGQTECAICYSVVGEDGRVPSKKCRTCRNIFHGDCLFKWFRSSNKSTCPLCRESFNYG